MRLRLIATALATAALAGALVFASAAAASRRAGQIFFYVNTFNAIGNPYEINRLAVHPATLLMAPDGHWAIVKVQWTGWGSPRAQATGVSDASDCNPSCAGGHRKRSPATIVLSHPIRLLGHTVYSCFRLTIARVPAANQNLCIKRATSGPGYEYSPVPRTP